MPITQWGIWIFSFLIQQKMLESMAFYLKHCYLQLKKNNRGNINFFFRVISLLCFEKKNKAGGKKLTWHQIICFKENISESFSKQFPVEIFAKFIL